MSSHITLIGINFAPEDTAIGLYSTQMMRHLAQQHTVSVVTGVPYYPQWKIWDDYSRAPKRFSEAIDGMHIYRYKQYVPQNPTFKNRIAHLLDFTVGSIRNILKIRECDLVICVIPFTASVALGWWLARRRGAKLWVHVQDFEFDAALESGLAGSEGGMKSRIFNGLFRLEKKLLDRADIVSTISFGMMEKLKSKTATRPFFFPNWVDQNFINPDTANQHAFMTSRKYKVLYSGNIGAKQDWEFFLKVVEHFRENGAIEFIVVGAGAKKEWLEASTSHLPLVVHHMPVAYEVLPDLLCSADAHILFQKNDVVDTVMPSKLLGMMASAKPSIVTGSLLSEAAGVFETSGGGYFFDSTDFDAVVKTIGTLMQSPEGSRHMGECARAYVIENFASEAVLERFSQKVLTLMES